MASADLRNELECSICLSLYTDPVILTCGHNFCRECISRVLDTQEESGVYSCPECREEFLKRPPLQRNLALRNIVENFRSTQPDEEDTKVFCSYCIHSSVVAVTFCLHCEASLCEEHLKVHSNSPKHVLSAPCTSLDTRKCPVHKKNLEYYCVEDTACICVSCKSGDHWGHQMELLPKASEEKKKKLRQILRKLRKKQKKVNTSVQNLQEKQSILKKQATDETERVVALFRDIRRQLDNLENKVLSEISRQEEQLSYYDLIQPLEIKMGMLSDKVLEIEELCNLTEPLTFLQKSNTVKVCDIKEEGNNDGGSDYEQPHNDADLDVTWVSETLCKGLGDILKGINGGVYDSGFADISLDEDTANNSLKISSDRRTATKTSYQPRQNTEKRFQNEPQVLSNQIFSSGHHYWEVDVGGSNNWIIGVCYPSIAREDNHSIVGCNSKSWGLDRQGNKYRVCNNDEVIDLSVEHYPNRVRVYLNYEGGQLSFFDLCDPIQHIYTFTATFTEPLHAAFFVNHNSIYINP